MPELPEVESTRRAVAPALEGKRIVFVDVARARMLRRQHNPADFATRMVGRTIRRFRRHGKFLMAELSGDLTWVTHLGMSGRVQLATSTETRSPHTNAVVRVGGRVEFRLVDPRTFGFVAVFTPAELAESTIGALGPDAYDHMPTTQGLFATLAGRTAPVKALLLDQRILSGVGNIYADESLHRARISPHREGGSLRGPEVAALRTGIRVTLEAGIEHGGTSLDDLAYLLPDGRTGGFVARLRVYGREHSKCGRCGGPIRRDAIRQRSSYWCPGCQR
jgi:formamidopyrimidine-DNA glycosylase